MKVDFKQTKDANQLNDEIDKLIAKAWKAIHASKAGSSEVEEVSLIVAELPALLVGLGYWVAEAEYLADKSKDNRDFAYDDELLKLTQDGTSVNKAEPMIKTRERYQKAQDEYREDTKTYKLLKNKLNGATKQWEGLRSRLSVIKDDIRRTDNG